MGALFVIPLYLLNYTLIETIVYGVPNALLFMIFSHHAFNITFYQVAYFYILCHYIHIRVDNIKKQTYGSVNWEKISKLFKSIDSVCVDVNEYNSGFWSKFLLCFWITVGSADVCYLFMIIFKPTNPIIKFILCYCFVIILLMFSFIIFIASLVNYRINGLYNVLNKTSISLSTRNKNSIVKTRMIIKVSITGCSSVPSSLLLFIPSSIHLSKEWLRRVSGSRVGSYSQLIILDVMK